MRRLDIGGCFLTDLPDEVGLLANLVHIELRKNQLTVASFPKSFRHLNCLSRVYIRFTSVASISNWQS
jgi:hypothetical protein